MQIKHPNFMFDTAQLDGLRARLTTDGALRARYDTMTATRQACLDEPLLSEEYANSAYDQHGKFYDVGAQLSRLMTVLGSVWAVERDDSCAKKLKEAMLHVCSFAAWTGPSNKDRDVPWHSDLSTTRIAVELAYGYDLLYDTLTEDERDVIASAIYDKGVVPLLEDWLLPQTRIHALDSMGHNWWSVCIALAGVALLPLIDRLPEQTWHPLFDEIDKALIGFLTYDGCVNYNKVPNYDKKGLFYESTSYFSYGTGELLRYLWQAERYFGRREALRATLPSGMTDAILSFAYPYRQGGANRVCFLNFGDSPLDANIRPMLRWLPLLGLGSEAVDTYLSRLPQSDDLLSLLCPLPVDGRWDGLDKTVLYPESGYAITRDSWQHDATLLAVKCGYTWNHAHADAGSFVLFSGGQPLLIDSGTVAYGHPLYSTYFRKDDGHNVLLVDGQGQRSEDQVRGSKFPGTLTNSYVRDGLLYVQADATGPVCHSCSRMYRNFLWLDDSVLVIVDDVLCHEPSTVQSLWHYHGQSKRCNPADGTLAVDLRNECAAARLIAVHPAGIASESKTGYLVPTKALIGTKVTGTEPQEVEYLSFGTTARTRVHHGISVLLLNDRMHDTVVERISEPEVVGVRLKTGNICREIRFNERADGRRMHINANHTLGTLDTDAYLLMTEQVDGAVRRILMVNGSYLRDEDRVLHHSYRTETKEIVL